MKKNIQKYYQAIFFNFFFFFLVAKEIVAKDLNSSIGEQLFFSNCNVCHRDGNNIIIPEKNLKLETLKANGMENLESIIYQVTNGKNGMPAFGGRLKEEEIEKIAKYVLEKTTINFQNK